jgi:hypothetical protein
MDTSKCSYEYVCRGPSLQSYKYYKWLSEKLTFLESFCFCRLVIAEIHSTTHRFSDLSAQWTQLPWYMEMNFWKFVIQYASSHVVQTRRCSLILQRRSVSRLSENYPGHWIDRGSETRVCGQHTDLTSVLSISFSCWYIIKPRCMPVQSILERNRGVEFHTL